VVLAAAGASFYSFTSTITALISTQMTMPICM
jgi:hypothetical protein